MLTLPRHAALFVALALVCPRVAAEEPLHARIDALIVAGAAGKPASSLADDAEFLRRVSLDLAGCIPSAAEARAFLADKTPDKRVRKIDRLLAAPTYAGRMADLFHVMLMERLGDHAEWIKYLHAAFAANKPWNVMAREILRADPDAPPELRGAAFFYSKRLENYGQNPVDYPALTRDVGRLFLGKDFRCAQCHDHLFIKDYKQQDFQGLFAFYQNTFNNSSKEPSVGERPTTTKVAYMSVFKKVPRQVGPRVPGLAENDIPPLEKGKEFARPADPKTRYPGVLKFSPLARVAEELPTANNPAFARNAVNRLWWVLMGRGLVHPLDLHHSTNPPSHPELLDLLAREFVDHQYDIKWLLRELALSQTYQRASVLPDGRDEPAPDKFLTALEKRLSAEQLLASVLQATAVKPAKLDAVRPRFLKAFANPAHEPEDEISPSLKATLFLLNDDLLLGLLKPSPGSLVDRLARLPEDGIAEELYLSVLARMPTAEERSEAVDYLKKNAARKPVALGHLAWALLASTEFGVNH
jgi:hypothetical protein